MGSSPSPARHVDDAERRARLAVRHALHPDHRVADTLAATRAMTVLHATEAASVHLAVAARTLSTTPADVDRALYVERAVVKQLAMRRTLFVLPRDLLPAALGSASARVAAEQRRLVARDAVLHDATGADGDAWLARARQAVQERLADGTALSARELREQLPELAGTYTYSPDKHYGGTGPLAPRVLTTLGAEGLILRGPNAGHWRLNRPTWVLASLWLGEQVQPLTPRAGYAELVRRWLRTFGPGTVEDVQWWLGSTKTAVRDALADVGAVPVSLCGGATGWLLPDDLDPVASPGPVGRPAADPRSHDDGLARSRLLPRPGGHAIPLRQQRQRRDDGLVGGARGGRVGPGRAGEGARPAAAGQPSPPSRARRARGRGRAAHRLARRGAGEHDLPLPAHEVRRAGLSQTRRAQGDCSPTVPP